MSTVNPSDYWPLSPDDLFKKVTIPEPLHEPITKAFHTEKFGETFQSYFDKFSTWSETRELFWKRWRRTASFRIMTIVQENKSKIDFINLLLTNEDFSIFLFTPTKTPSERAEERLQELLSMDIITDDGVNNSIVRILSSIAKDREAGYVETGKNDTNPFDGMPPELVEMLQKAVKGV